MDKAYLVRKLKPLFDYGWNDEMVLEAQCNADGQCWFVTRDNGVVLKGSLDPDWVNGFVHGLAHYHDAYLTPERPYLDAILPLNNERINIKIPPIVSQASFVLRKPLTHVLSLQHCVTQGVLTQAQANVLRAAIINRQNILVSGQPGSGKTTFVNALLDTLANETPSGHRVMLLEQVRELQCRVTNSESLITQDTVSMTTLLWLAMRNSPERIIVGEVRDGGTAIDCCKAWNTGCRGGMATIHANSATAAIQRLLDLALEVVMNPPIALVAEALDLIVHLTPKATHPAGRIVDEIIAVNGFNAAKQCWNITPIMTQEERSLQ